MQYFDTDVIHKFFKLRVILCPFSGQLEGCFHIVPWPDIVPRLCTTITAKGKTVKRVMSIS